MILFLAHRASYSNSNARYSAEGLSEGAEEVGNQYGDEE